MVDQILLHPTRLQGAIIGISIIIALLSGVFDIADELLIIGLFLFILLNQSEIRTRMLIKRQPGTSILPYMYYYSIILLFILSFNYIFSWVYEVVPPIIHLYLVGFMYFIVLSDWKIFINNVPFQFINIFVLAEDLKVKPQRKIMLRKSFLLPSSIIIAYVLVTMTLDFFLALYEDRILEFSLQIISILFISLTLVFMHNYFLSSYFWEVKRGEAMFSKPELPELENQPIKLQWYMRNAYRLGEPTEEFIEFLEKNTPLLVDHADDINYIGFHTYLIYAVNNWARKSDPIIFNYILIILSSFKGFLRFGVIPIHRRKLFYYFYLSLYKAGYFREEWMEEIDYEVSRANFYAFRIFEIIKYPAIMADVNKYWTDIYNSYLYRGPFGFDKLHSLLKNQNHRGVKNTWEQDVTVVAGDFLRVFAGKNSRQIFKSGLDIPQRALHLASGKSLDTYKKYSEKLDSIKLNEMEESIKTEQLPSMEQRREIILRNLGEEKIDRSRRAVNIARLLKSIVIFLLLITINTTFLYLLSLISKAIMTGVLFIEVTILIFFSIDVDTEDSQRLLDRTKNADSFSQIVINYKSATNLVLFLLINIFLVYYLIGFD